MADMGTHQFSDGSRITRIANRKVSVSLAPKFGADLAGGVIHRTAALDDQSRQRCAQSKAAEHVSCPSHHGAFGIACDCQEQAEEQADAKDAGAFAQEPERT